MSIESQLEQIQQHIDGVPLSDSERIKRLQFAKDDYGNRKMSSDPEYRKYVEGEMQKLNQGAGFIVDPVITHTDKWWENDS